jgi:hypothetical protein
LVAPDLLVTCLHVLTDGTEPDLGSYPVYFPQAEGRPQATGRVVPGAWRAVDQEDVAFLRLEPALVGVPVLGLRTAHGAFGSLVHSYGYPDQAPQDGHPGTAKIGGLFSVSGDVSLLSLTDANALAEGFSGSPLVDDDGLVVGMITAHPALNPYGRGAELAYATPATVLQRIGPGLTVDDTCPYPGLSPFTAQQTRWFHGRGSAITALADLVLRHRGGLLLSGPSGSGKSSLVRAGLLPADASRGHRRP